jgi:hypothetical protein
MLQCPIKSEDENMRLALKTSEFYRFNFEIFTFENPENCYSAARLIESYRLPIGCSFSGDLIISGVLWNSRQRVALY